MVRKGLVREMGSWAVYHPEVKRFSGRSFLLQGFRVFGRKIESQRKFALRSSPRLALRYGQPVTLAHFM